MKASHLKQCAQIIQFDTLVAPLGAILMRGVYVNIEQSSISIQLTNGYQFELTGVLLPQINTNLQSKLTNNSNNNKMVIYA